VGLYAVDLVLVEAGSMGWLGENPSRGRIVLVNFDLGGSLPLHAELSGPAQPCLVLRVDGYVNPPLVTVVPLTALHPQQEVASHHRLELKSFRDWPAPHLFGSLPRWVRCAHLVTVSLDRCADPSYKPARGDRLSAIVRATAADMASVEIAVLRALGIAGNRRDETMGMH
jgi:uncharacterized protein YifN (PemK superfamily)